MQSKLSVVRVVGRTGSAGEANDVPKTPELASIVDIDPDHRVRVRLAGCRKPVPARLSTHLDPGRLRQAIDNRADVLVLRGSGPNQVVIIGLIDDRFNSEPNPIGEVDPGESPSSKPLARGVRELQAQVDGQRVRIVGHDEIVLECGKASITLRRNGRVVVKGTHVETTSAGVNRIKGARVRIN